MLRRVILRTVDVLLAIMFFAVVLMLGARDLHDEYPAVPPLGFWTSIAVGVIVAQFVLLVAAAWQIGRDR